MAAMIHPPPSLSPLPPLPPSRETDIAFGIIFIFLGLALSTIVAYAFGIPRLVVQQLSSLTDRVGDAVNNALYK
jgi:hypothetical protein